MVRPGPVHLQPDLRLRGLESRPPDEIPDGGWAVAPEIPSSQFGERLIAGQGPGIRSPIRQQRVGGLFASPRAAANHSRQFGVHRDVRQLSRLTRESGSLEVSAELSTRQITMFAKCALDDTGG